MTIRILLADDHAMFRNALYMTLKDVPGIDLVAQAVNGNQVLDLVAQTHPDIVCMDINMPKLNGIDATTQLIALQPDIKVIGLSSHVDRFLISKMMQAGAMAYVEKSHAGCELLSAIYAVNQNKRYIDTTLCSDATLWDVLYPGGTWH